MGSVGQRAAKLQPIKVGALKEKSEASANTAEVCASAMVGLRFGGQQPYRPNITCIERSKPPLKVCQKFKRLAAL